MDPDEADERRKFKLQVALETRRFEIELFWSRSLFFWGFIAAAVAAATWSYEKDHPVLAILGTCLGLVCSAVWTFANRGSRLWHVVWESRVHELEKDVIGKLFSKSIPDRESAPGWWRGVRFSPSRLVIALSDFVFALWVLALGAQLLIWTRADLAVYATDFAVYGVVVFTGLTIVTILYQTRKHTDD